ncbi:MAG: ammonium transporter [Ilumatobacteraceae bacterium]|nr:ammonium transporter [Ilumatobacteraceae bacterium]MDP4929667.1 ammonium transporter [Ilumatobacteraceae bacterium]
MKPFTIKSGVTALSGTLGALAMPGLVRAAEDAPPSLEELQTLVPGLQVTLDNVFVLVATVLVVFMHAGFVLVEAGLTRAKNAGNIVMKNLINFSIGAVVFFAVGFAIAFGGGFDGLGAYIGGGGWFIGDGAFAYGNLTPFTFFIFQAAFAATAATIVSGAMAERTKFGGYVAYALIMTAVIYPIVVRWQWGGGWLYQLSTPFHDFAGSTIVHLTGGVAAFAAAKALGPRIGRYGTDGKPRAIPGHSIPFAIVGCFILLVGWFGFNAGSQLGADPVIGRIATTTLIAAGAGAVMAALVTRLQSGKTDVAMTGNGLLAGLVGITAGCYAVSTIGALIIGLVSGLIVVFAVSFFDKIRVDDPVGAISVHGVCGAFGTIAVGLFSNEESEGFIAKGLFYGGGTDQLVSQIIGVVAVAVFVFVASTIMFAVIKATIGLRVSEQEEREGLDVHEHGSPGYGSDRAMA